MSELPPPGWKLQYKARFDFEGILDTKAYSTRAEAIQAGTEETFFDRENICFWIVEFFVKLPEGEGFVLDANGERIYPGTRLNHVDGPPSHYFWAVEVNQEDGSMLTDPRWGNRMVSAKDYIVKNPRRPDSHRG